MKMRKVQKSHNYQVTRIALADAWTSTDRNDAEHVWLKGQDGWITTNFKSIWDRQNLDIETLAQGTVLEITYEVKPFGNRTFNNFAKVEVVDSQPPAVQQPVMPAPETPLPEVSEEDVFTAVGL